MGRVAKPWFRASRNGWYVELNGRQHRLADGKAGKGEVARAFARLLASEGKAPALSDPTVIEAAELFLDHCQAVSKPGTYEQHRQKLTAFARRFGKVKVSGLSVSAVQRWLAGLEVSDTTRRNYVTSIKACLNWCVSEGLCSPHPLAKLPKPKGARRERVLSPDEKARLIEGARGTAIEGFLAGLLLSGCRPHELAALEASSVDFEAGTARVVGKGRARTVYLPVALLAVLRGLAERYPAGPLFRNSDGRPWSRNAIRCAFKRLRERTGLAGVSAYTIRHTWATDALVAGVAPGAVAELLGHRDLKMVSDVYSHIAERRDVLKREAERAVS